MNGGSTGTQRSSRTNRRTWREGAIQCLVKIQSILMICVVTLCKGERGVEGPRGLAGLDGIPVLLCPFNVYLVDGLCVACTGCCRSHRTRRITWTIRSEGCILIGVGKM